MPRKRWKGGEKKWARESCGESEITRASKDIVRVAPLTAIQLLLYLILRSLFWRLLLSSKEQQMALYGNVKGYDSLTIIDDFIF